ncbi:unnamed protein product, partial [Chrysoparadoxa australica]
MGPTNEQDHEPASLELHDIYYATIGLSPTLRFPHSNKFTNTI